MKMFKLFGLNDDGNRASGASICATHIWGAWTIATLPGWETEGVEERRCLACAKSETAPIPPYTRGLEISGAGVVTGRGTATGTIIVIPSTIAPGSTVPVTAVGQSAFSNDKLTRVIIPSSVTSIGHWAFQSNNLSSVTIPVSVTVIGLGAFCNNNLTSVIIPSSVTTIVDGAFANNKLVSVSIPSSVIYLAGFENNSLASITIPSSVTRIGADAFAGNQLTSITIPSSVTAIMAGAFANNSLTSVTIPSSVTTIETEAFAGNQLTSVTIPFANLEKADEAWRSWWGGDWMIGIPETAFVFGLNISPVGRNCPMRAE
ncbi:MAG: leucine-rich repeat domain-containing protein [Treponema sp.]|nr:leucine-rich repeat domain-containing protein [Treponema sp.]